MERHDMTERAALDCCPFCDGPGVIHELDQPNEYVVCCDDCAASSAVVVALGEDPVPTLAYLWNRRQYRITPAAHAVLKERTRQIHGETFNQEHDDCHTEGELAKAAVCYAWISAQGETLRAAFDRPPPTWPAKWDKDSWKPTDRRRDLVKAGALILAEIERLDRTNPCNLDEPDLG
jgi:hypothetical protein